MDEVDGGRVILYVDVKLLVLCGVSVVDLTWAGERERILAMAGSRILVGIVRFGLFVDSLHSPGREFIPHIISQYCLNP